MIENCKIHTKLALVPQTVSNPEEQMTAPYTPLQPGRTLQSSFKHYLLFNCFSEKFIWYSGLRPGAGASTTTQVVTSAGRRFIVSPVPESRLKEQFFSAVQPPAPIFEQPAACKQNDCFYYNNALFG